MIDYITKKDRQKMIAQLEKQSRSNEPYFVIDHAQKAIKILTNAIIDNRKSMLMPVLGSSDFGAKADLEYSIEKNK